MMAIVVTWSVGFFFAYLFACRGHFAAWWGPIIDITSKCGQAFLMLYILAISDFIIDAIIILLPLPMVSYTSLISVKVFLGSPLG